MYDKFIERYGDSRLDSGLGLVDFNLEQSEQLKSFVKNVGAGIFLNGFLSVLSKREQVVCNEWEEWLPQGSKLFASSVFGLLLFTSGEDLWLVDSQYGQIIESDFTLEDFFNDTATTEALEMLRFDLFEYFTNLGGRLGEDEFLTPAPMCALGGDWDISTLIKMKSANYVAFTGQLFLKGSETPAEIFYLNDEK